MLKLEHHSAPSRLLTGEMPTYADTLVTHEFPTNLALIVGGAECWQPLTAGDPHHNVHTEKTQ